LTYQERQWMPNSIYHITARGTHGDNIFRQEDDFENYCSILNNNMLYYKDKFEVYCYCLMSNHVHIVMKIMDQSTGNFFARLHGIYARNYNSKYDYTGHLFQDRYFAKLINSDEQFLTVSRYVHLNPVKAKIVENPDAYKWSSYSMYTGNKQERIIDASKILFHFKESGNCREAYKKFVEGVANNNKLLPPRDM